VATGEPKVSHSHPTPDTKHTEKICKAINIRNPYSINKVKETHNSNNLATLARKRGEKKNKKQPPHSR